MNLLYDVTCQHVNIQKTIDSKNKIWYHLYSLKKWKIVMEEYYF